MISDKVCVVSSKKVFRRIKDLIDLYYFSYIFEYNCTDIKKNVKENKKTIGDFYELLNNVDEMKHSYEKFRIIGTSYKPDFDIVYKRVIEYIKPLLHLSIKK